MMVLSTLSLQPYNEVLCWFISPFNEIAIGLIFARVGRLGGKCKVIYLFLKLNFSSVVLLQEVFWERVVSLWLVVKHAYKSVNTSVLIYVKDFSFPH